MKTRGIRNLYSNLAPPVPLNATSAVPAIDPTAKKSTSPNSAAASSRATKAAKKTPKHKKSKNVPKSVPVPVVPNPPPVGVCDPEWERNYQKLAKQKAKLGLIDVSVNPRQNPMAEWMVKQCIGREELHITQIHKLNAIGFRWNLPIPDKFRFDFMYAKLKRYHARYGDCLVPVRWKEDPKLGRWVSRQRETQNTLPEARREKLNALGFTWRVKEWHKRKLKDEQRHDPVTRADIEGRNWPDKMNYFRQSESVDPPEDAEETLQPTPDRHGNKQVHEFSMSAPKLAARRISSQSSAPADAATVGASQGSERQEAAPTIPRTQTGAAPVTVSPSAAVGPEEQELVGVVHRQDSHQWRLELGKVAHYVDMFGMDGVSQMPQTLREWLSVQLVADLEPIQKQALRGVLAPIAGATYSPILPRGASICSTSPQVVGPQQSTAAGQAHAPLPFPVTPNSSLGSEVHSDPRDWTGSVQETQAECELRALIEQEQYAALLTPEYSNACQPQPIEALIQPRHPVDGGSSQDKLVVTKNEPAANTKRKKAKRQLSLYCHEEARSFAAACSRKLQQSSRPFKKARMLVQS